MGQSSQLTTIEILDKLCIPSRRNRKDIIPYDAKIYQSHHKIENTFGRLKDWRRVAAHYDRCPVIFMSAIGLAATVLFWLLVQSLAFTNVFLWFKALINASNCFRSVTISPNTAYFDPQSTNTFSICITPKPPLR